jgi:hypothetical protein
MPKIIDSETRRRRLIIGYVLAVLGCIGLLCLINWLPLYTENGWICQNSVSTKGHRVWLWGSQSNSWSLESSLQKTVSAEYPYHFENRWCQYMSTSYNILGKQVKTRPGQPGPVIYFVGRIWQLDEYVAPLNKAQCKELYDLFASGNQKAIKTRLALILKSFAGSSGAKTAK